MAGEITVVVPAYNAGRFVRATLESVAAQRVQPQEIVVADDGSTDDTCAVVEAFAAAHGGCPVRLLREPHRGPGAARNAAMRAARTEWVAFLDSDDLWEPAKIAAVVEAITAHPEANFFCHNETIRFLDGSSRVTDYARGFRRDKPLPPQLFRHNFFSTSAVVCRRTLVVDAGGFDEGLSSAQDYEMWLRMSPSLMPIFVPQALGHYVLRDGNITTTRFWRRLVNIVRVKHRHREKAGLAAYVYQVARVALLHLAVPAREAVKRRLRPALRKP